MMVFQALFDYVVCLHGVDGMTGSSCFCGVHRLSGLCAWLKLFMLWAFMGMSLDWAVYVVCLPRVDGVPCLSFYVVCLHEDDGVPGWNCLCGVPPWSAWSNCSPLPRSCQPAWWSLHTRLPTTHSCLGCTLKCEGALEVVWTLLVTLVKQWTTIYHNFQELVRLLVKVRTTGFK